MAAICIVATLIVLFVTDNELQKWINKSCLGKHKGERAYGSTAEEMQAFNKIFAS